MKQSFWFALLAAATVGVGGLVQDGSEQAAKDSKPPPKPGPPVPTSNQLLMRDKLTYASKALEGLSVEDFDKIAESAEWMRMISRAASWHVLDSEQYTRYSKNFQEQATDMRRHAKEKNLDAAALDYVRLSLTCVQCHQYVRDVKSKRKQ